MLFLTIAEKWKLKPQKYREEEEHILEEIIMQSNPANLCYPRQDFPWLPSLCINHYEQVVSITSNKNILSEIYLI